MKTVQELPDKDKLYTIHMSNKDEFLINGEERAKLLRSKQQYIELPKGDIINKAFIVTIVFERSATRDRFLNSPEGQKLLSANI